MNEVGTKSDVIAIRPNAPADSDLLVFEDVQQVLAAAYKTARAAIALVSHKMLDNYAEELQSYKRNALSQLESRFHCVTHQHFSPHALEEWLIGCEKLVDSVRCARNRLAAVEREERDNLKFSIFDEVMVLAVGLISQFPRKGRIVGESKGFKDRPYYQIELAAADGSFLKRYYDNGEGNTVFCYARQLQPFNDKETIDAA